MEKYHLSCGCHICTFVLVHGDHSSLNTSSSIAICLMIFQIIISALIFSTLEWVILSKKVQFKLIPQDM